ncbi:hypothetical protein CHS0354_024876 [Potamilus streckersoni]|uniref:Uncharacterized protein n=1 Tax=Potamilus streckersoni TaxID=2493646 RepID=A0AAE0TG36_9BIVA|nr:hypothetical protein CHS0354_024876 [Potamilus streckersoni]
MEYKSSLIVKQRTLMTDDARKTKAVCLRRLPRDNLVLEDCTKSKPYVEIALIWSMTSSQCAWCWTAECPATAM